MCETKKCSKCGEVKDLREFHKNASRKTGASDECKICIKKRGAKYVITHKEERNIRQRAWKERNPRLVIEAGRKSSNNERANLTNNYLVSAIRTELNLTSKDGAILEELIELKRQQIKIYRLLKEKQNEQTCTA